MSAALNPADTNVTGIRTTQETSRSRGPFWTGGVIRRTIAFIPASLFLLFAGRWFAWEAESVVTEFLVEGDGWAQLSFTIIALVALAVIVALVIFIVNPTQWLKDHPKTYRLMIVVAVAVTIPIIWFGREAAVAIANNAMVLVAGLVVIFALAVIWAFVAHDIVGWLMRKSTR